MTRYVKGLAIATAAFVLFAATPASAGVLNLAWNANPESNISGYRLSYGTQSGSYGTTIDVGKTTSWQVRGLPDGQRYYFVLYAINTNGVASPPSPEANAVSVGLAFISSDIGAPAPTGKPITWTLRGSVGVPLEFAFYRYSQASNTWSQVQPYGPSDTYTWTPTAADAGTYSLQGWARLPGSPETFQAWRGFGPFVVADGAVTVGSVEADRPLPVASGTAVTWKAKGAGGPAPLQYRFVKRNVNTGASVELRAYSAVDSVSWTPAANDAGTYVIDVYARGAGSGSAYDALRSTDPFDVKNTPPQGVIISTQTTFPAGVGTSVTWKAMASGGQGGLEYAFYKYSEATNAWTLGQAYSSSNTFTWAPPAGNYVLQAWARRVGSSASYETTGSTGYFQVANSTPMVTSVVTSVPSPYGTGAPVTWTVNAAGGPGPLQYKFYAYNQDRDTWTLLRDYSPSNSLTWTFSSFDGGRYQLQAWVRKSGSSAQYDAWYGTDFVVADGPAAISFVTSDVGTNVAIGTPVTLTAFADGGPGLLEYTFSRFNNVTQSWTPVQAYSWDNTLNWVPTEGDQGSYVFQVLARRSGSAAAYESYWYLNFDVH